MSYQPTPIEPSSRVRIAPQKLFVLGCGGLIATFGLVCAGFVAWLVVLPEGGVRLNNELNANDREHLAELEISRGDVIAYVDRSFFQDGSDVVVLTVYSLVHSKDGHQTIATFSEIGGIRHAVDSMSGHTLELDLADGRSMKINIPAFSGGESFVHQLERALGRSLSP